jgi:hypothetical protein
LVQLQSVEAKITLFKNIHYLRALSKYTDINVSNDLTKTERASEKELWKEAKQMNDAMTLFYPIFSLRLTGDNTMIFIGINISKLTFDAATPHPTVIG